MEKLKNNNEELALDEEIENIIKKSGVEEKNLRQNIENEEKIWGYKITDEYEWFLTKWEKWFAMIISESEAWIDDINLWIIVKFEEWKITIRDTQQEPFDDGVYNELTLAPDEEIKWNDNVNKINKVLNSWWFSTIKGEELEKLAKKIEWIKK